MSNFQNRPQLKTFVQHQMPVKTPGYIVVTEKGETGRTFHYKGTINNKIPVYLQINSGNSYSENAILYERDSLKITGFID